MPCMLSTIGPISIVVFDCDGVILESVDVKTNAFGQTVAEYGPEAVSRLLDYHMANGGVSRYRKFEWFYREVLGREITKDQLQALGERFKQLAFDGVMNAPMVPGALECIETIYRKIPMYVASGAPHDELGAVLRARNLLSFFKGVHGSPPGKTELLKRIIADEGANAAEMLMVGDSPTDLKAAEACGAQFYGRGEMFRDSGYPWFENLGGLLGFISERGL